ncbi:hypothetical protein [Novosphingobium sp. SG720]|uniref:hypothetical protein n=1 Tax=Novosphingobium sp. SG720 TaxID=2586998 RepID=UPI00144842D1|nr:hypothetical protein [Novosphingobium sp. SG720]NKJ43184.1 hypothetical protein [Novosphingobium sp. SG720]
MSTAVNARQYAELHTNNPAYKVLQRDKIIDEGTIGLFDFGYKWGYAARVSPVVGGTSFANFVKGGAPAVNGPLAKAWAGNQIAFPMGHASANVALPAAWKMPAGASHFAIGFLGKVATSGYPTGAAGTQNALILGCRAGGNAQYQFYFQYDKTTGAMTRAFLGFNLQLFDITAFMPTDGLEHHFAIEFEVITASTWQARFWVDNAIKYTSPPQAWSGALNQAGAAVPAIGAYYQASTYETAAFSIGRIWLQDPTIAGAKSIAAMNAADFARNFARFG